MTVINVPHPAVMLRALRSSPRQLARSWYMFAFQLPWLPEATFRFRNFRSLARGLQTTSRPGTFSDADLDEYRRSLRFVDCIKLKARLVLSETA